MALKQLWRMILLGSIIFSIRDYYGRNTWVTSNQGQFYGDYHTIQFGEFTEVYFNLYIYGIYGLSMYFLNIHKDKSKKFFQVLICPLLTDEFIRIT